MFEIPECRECCDKRKSRQENNRFCSLLSWRKKFNRKISSVNVGKSFRKEKKLIQQNKEALLAGFNQTRFKSE